MAGVDDTIGEWIKRAEQTGELKRGRYWGKPFDLDDGSAETPARLRMTYRILKNAGYAPQEVELLKRLADLKSEHDAQPDPARRRALEREVAELSARLSGFLENLRRTAGKRS